MYYDGQVPQYDYYYIDENEPPPQWLQHKDQPLIPHPAVVERVDQVDQRLGLGSFSLSTLIPYLPFLLIIPVLAAASYYLLVLNGPTPVVKERSELIDSLSDKVERALGDHFNNFKRKPKRSNARK